MSAVELAVAFVFFSNAVFLVAAGFVLFRMMQQTRAAQSALTRSADSTDEAGRRLRDLVRNAGPVFAAAAAAGTAASQDKSTEIDRLHHQAKDLVHRLAELLRGASSPAGAAEMSALVREMARLQADNQDLREQTSRLRLDLTETLGRPSATDAGPADGEATLVMTADGESLDRLQARLAELQARLDAVSSSADAEANEGSMALDELRSKMSVVERENGQLRSELDALKEQIARTLREKDFIEGRFLLLDQALLAAGAEVTPSNGDQSLH